MKAEIKAKKTKALTSLQKIVLKAKAPEVETVSQHVGTIAETLPVEVTPEVIAETPPEVTPEVIAETPPEVTPEVIAETLAETATTKSPSLWDTFNEVTEEDTKPEKSRLEHISESISDTDLLDEDLDLTEDSPKMRKEMADVKATALVEFGEIVMTVICMWISGDWSQKAQEIKFIVSPQKKKAVKISIMRILMQSKTKTNPYMAITLLCIGSTLPMLIMAFLTMVQRKREKAEQAKHLTKETFDLSERNRIAAANYAETLEQNKNLETYNVNKIHEVYDEKPLTVIEPKPIILGNEIKKETRGRHKKTCATYNGKKCNCKK